MKILVQIIVCLSLLTLVSCETTRHTVAHRSRQPQFIDDIYMDKHNKNCTTTECIDRSTKYPENKTVVKKHTGRWKPAPADAATTPPPVATGKTTPAKGEVKLSDNTGAPDNLKEKYATMMNVSRHDIDDPVLFKFIDTWYGVDYRLGGCDMDGIDCSGFVKKLYADVYGVDLLRTSYEMYANCEHLRKADEANRGDLVFFKTRGRRISHVGVYLMNGYFVHASTTQGIMISSLNEEYWHKHFAGIGRMGK